jgi:hypothetical protein
MDDHPLLYTVYLGCRPVVGVDQSRVRSCLTGAQQRANESGGDDVC